MFQINSVLEAKRGINYQQNMERLYMENLGLVRNLANAMNLTIADREEYYQTAFLALDDAVRAFSEKVNIALCHTIGCVLSIDTILYVLEMKYPVRLNATVTDKSNYKYIEKMVETEQADIGELDLSFEQVEYCILADAV